ncbi:MAG: hypothetical protein QM579_09450 [Desulfovibrio sp.]|uniref:hypothetical protein n=1 Tax=Desulfovibrio sp. TaxID=885 RepID=UPI0039E5C103
MYISLGSAFCALSSDIFMVNASQLFTCTAHAWREVFGLASSKLMQLPKQSAFAELYGSKVKRSYASRRLQIPIIAHKTSALLREATLAGALRRLFLRRFERATGNIS